MADTATRSNVFKQDSDVHITLEDQKKINLFAKYNAKFEEFKSEIKSKTNELKNYEDAEDELFMRADEDITETVPIRIGDNFIYMSGSKTSDFINKSKEKIESEMKKMEDDMAVLKDNMTTLKTQLYAKFGSHINLEGDE